ncbi:MAG TPA: hypothetical protein VFO16_20135 [Pseudonocardiaceae bacterium]|nr:hypothetical protein [Pseudonocardiaceae bacterium]
MSGARSDSTVAASPATGADTAARDRQAHGRVRPLSSAELISAGVRPELLTFMALRRTADGGLAQSGERYSLPR